MISDRLRRLFKLQSKEQPEASQPETPAATVRPEDYVGDSQEANEQAVRDGFMVKAKSFISKIPMADEVVASYFCMLDPATPRWVKGVVAAALAYFIMPIDAVMDAIPVAGLTDDIGVLSVALTSISAYITDEHRAKARQWMRSEQVKGAKPVDEVIS